MMRLLILAPASLLVSAFTINDGEGLNDLRVSDIPTLAGNYRVPSADEGLGASTDMEKNRPRVMKMVAAHRASVEENDPNVTNSSHEKYFDARDSLNETLKDLESLTKLMVAGKKMQEFKKYIYIAAPVLVLVCIIFEIFHGRLAECDLNEELKDHSKVEDGTHEMRLQSLFGGVGPLLGPYFYGREHYKRWGVLVFLVGLNWCSHGLGLIMMVWQQEFWNCVQARNGDMLVDLIIFFSIMLVTLIILQVYFGYIQGLLTIHLRKHMTTTFVNRWLNNKAFYHMEIRNDIKVENPDQRIQDDVRQFIDAALDLLFGFIKAVTTLCTSVPILFRVSPDYMFAVVYFPGWMAIFAVVFAFSATAIGHAIGKDMIFVHYMQQRYEAYFRYGVVNIRDNAESIALYGSEDVEYDLLKLSFRRIIRVYWETMKIAKRLGFFTIFYMQVSLMLPMIMVSPNFMRNQVTLGDMMIIFSSFGQVKSSLEWVLLSYVSITSFRACADRLVNLLEATEPVKSGPLGVEKLSAPPPGAGDANITGDKIEVRIPAPKDSKEEDRVLWDNANFKVKAGQFVLLSAPEGSGKSAFFRAMGGIWPYASGQSFVPEGTLFIPQKSYIPQGTLKQAVTYPRDEGDFTDEEVRNALHTVGLDIVKETPLDKKDNWGFYLSGGERQRMALAHVILLKPPCLFLDEATSALSEDSAREVYTQLRKPGVLPQGASVVSISHDVTLLRPMHDKHYTYDKSSRKWAET